MRVNLKQALGKHHIVRGTVADVCTMAIVHGFTAVPGLRVRVPFDEFGVLVKRNGLSLPSSLAAGNLTDPYELWRE